LDWECRDPECGDENGPAESDIPDAVLGSSDLGGDESPEEIDSDKSAGEHRTYKDDSTLIDQQSTGRKRAARWYPLDDTALCEWAMKKNCGGGKHPITGCFANLQQARHHGPDKNTLNNDKGNVHRICHTCHNRWHTLNDDDYVWADVMNMHAPETATVIDIQESEKFWEGRATVKAKD
jgi:hypothetical protein